MSETDVTPTFTRDSVLAGNHARRATTLLYAIENRSALLTSRDRLAMARFETERSMADRERAFLGALAEGRTPPLKPTIQDIDRHASGWADLVPDDPGLRAAVLQRLVAKYGLPRAARGIRRVLGVSDPVVQAAYARQNAGASPDDGADASLPTRERLRWRRAALSAKLESLPPFWLAYALTLTETVGGGILALPIALAAFGPAGATVVLAFFGLINMLTVAVLVEAITRDGHMRYGNAFFGRLIGDYLGRPANAIAMPALFLLDAVGFLVGLVAFGATIAGITGVSPAVGAAGLFAVTIVILRRGSLDATVAVAVAVGLVNLSLVIVLSILALANARPDAGGSGPGIPLDARALELIFGVALVSYFGHTSAGHAAKVVLAKDPGGRQLLTGNVAAMATAMGIYIVFVLTVTAAVGSDVLRGYDGTAITLLADRVGPMVTVIGTVYLTLGVGLSSLYLGLGIFNQMTELIEAATKRRLGGRGQGEIAWFAFRASPLLAIFGLVIVLLDRGSISFTGPLSFVGTLTLPLLGGVFPILVFLAARRRGERAPARPVPWVGHPLVALIIASIFLAGVLVFGLWIWTGLLERLAALGVSGAIVAIAVVSWRRGSFRPRTVVEYRVEPGPPVFGVVSVVADGRAIPATFELNEGGALRTVVAHQAVVAAPARLASVRVALPAAASGELEVWVHAVAPDGATSPTPVTVVMEGADEPTRRQDTGAGVIRMVVGTAAPTTLTISPTPGIAAP